MIDTPRTDNAALNGDGTTVPADFAADLERELTAAKAEVERLREELARLTTPVPLLEREETGGCILWARDEDGWFESARIGATHWTPLPDVKETK